MKGTDKAIVFGVLAVVLAVAFYLMLLAPKRDKVSELNQQADALKSSISQQEQVASFGEAARQDFPKYYGRLVVLGKAVPDQADTASMLVQLSSVSSRTNAKFIGIELGQGDSASGGTGTSSAPAPAAAAGASTSTATTPSASTTGSSTSSTSATGSTSTAGATGTTPSTSGTTSGTTATSGTSAASTLVPATEASASTLPIGATVGPAGLPTLPYDLTMQGNFFQVANFIGGVDNMVTPKDVSASQISADGRLLTVDGFALKIDGSPQKLSANIALTAYSTPEDQGLTLGASPSGPAPVSPTAPGAAPTQPASSVVAK